MSEDFRRGVLEVLLMVNRNITEGRNEVKALRAELKQQITQLQEIAVRTADDVATLRSRAIEQASRHGIEIHEHETFLIKQDARITRLERRIERELGSDPPDAE